MKEDRTSLLSEIRDVEEECYQKLEEAKKEAERIIAQAEKEAQKSLVLAEKEATETARRHYDASMESLKQEILSIQARGEEEGREVREEGIKKVPLAVDQIIRTVMEE